MSQESGKKGQKRPAGVALAGVAAATPSGGAAPATPQTQSKRHKQREAAPLVVEPEVEDAGAVSDGGGEGDPATDNDEEATDDANSNRNTTDQDGPPLSPAATEKVMTARHSTAEVQRAPHCPYCCELLGTLVSEDRRSPPFGPCPHPACSLMMHMPFGGEVNLAIRQAKTEPKGKNSTTASVVAPVLDFSRREQELGKIALLGPVYPLYSDTAAVPDLDIDRILHGAFLSETHEIRPTGTLALIRSGKISMLSLITHRSTEDASKEMAASAVATPAANAMYTVPLVPLTNLAEFHHLLIRVILPCLVNRNRASLEWLALAASVEELDRLYGWAAALKYIDGIIGPQMKLRAPFGECNTRLLQSIQAQFIAAAVHKRPAASSAAAARTPAAAQTSRRQPNPLFCQSWNFTKEGCTLAACTLPHVCAYVHKAGKDGRKCPADDGSDHTGYQCAVHVHAPRANRPGAKPQPAAQTKAPLSVVKAEKSARSGGAAAANKE